MKTLFFLLHHDEKVVGTLAIFYVRAEICLYFANKKPSRTDCQQIGFNSAWVLDTTLERWAQF